tara:strand:+ start:2654 stop:4462 length:1809 start_codon:yes stop_codon:yes gene_type:complete
MATEKDIKYLNREFGDLRQSLIEHAKNYFPDAYNDFSPTSPGMMFIEMAAYVGDVLSFYQDNQLQETFLQHAKDPANLYSLAYMMGYTPRATAAAETTLTVTQRVAATSPNYLPNFNQALKIAANSSIASTATGNTNFLTTKEVDFSFSSSYDPTEITVFSVDSGNPAEYLLSKKVNASSGEIATTTFSFTTAEKFATVQIDEPNIIGVLDVTDSEGNTWTEVPFLAQDTVIKEQTNTASDNDLAPKNLVLQKVSRRFVTRFTSKNILQLQFGAGISELNDNEFLPSPENLQPTNIRLANSLDVAYDPSNFLFSRTYGLAPSNTTLTVRYLKGGGINANAPANSITDQAAVTITVSDNTYQDTLAFFNPEPATGGKDGDTVEELRQNSLRAFSEQKRTVTLDDYTVRSLALPSQFGSIAKSYAVQASTDDTKLLQNLNSLDINLYVLAYDNLKNLTNASQSLRENLKKYLSLYKMITDSINILDAFVINIKVKFEIVTLPNTTGREVLLACNEKLKDYFDIAKWSINQPVNLSEVYTLLDRVKGVQTVKNIELTNLAGGNYSQYEYDVKGATRDNIVYPSYDPSIFEVKYPNTDIEGRIITL